MGVEKLRLHDAGVHVGRATRRPRQHGRREACFEQKEHAHKGQNAQRERAGDEEKRRGWCHGTPKEIE